MESNLAPLAFPPLHAAGIAAGLWEQRAAIESWFAEQWAAYPAPLYGSIDLRDAGYKLAPVDTNLFPAGFNNLAAYFLPAAVAAMRSAITQIDPTIRRVLIVPESHTRNLFYLENLGILREIVENAGFEVRCGSLLADLQEASHIDLPSGRKLSLEPLRRTDDSLGVAGFDPDLVILNNDLSGGTPAIAEGISQPMVPALGLGWASRRKSVHFCHYRDVAEAFAGRFDLDPWRIDPLFRNCGEIDFMKGTGKDCLQRNVERLLTAIEAKYESYGIDATPFVFMKADSGTYGMGVMPVHSVDQITELNRKERTRMATTKEGQKVTKVILQEGVYTSLKRGGATAEPVVYLIGDRVVGGFYRVHSERAPDQSLNSPGMRFESFPPTAVYEQPLAVVADPESPTFYAYGVIARLAHLAAAHEVAELAGNSGLRPCRDTLDKPPAHQL
jgi:glutamate--cysteine ligase